MDKLIITITCDSTMSFPENPYCHNIEDVKFFADEYNRAVDAGASITHIHGVHWLEDKIQPDGRKLSRIDFDGWQELHDKIKGHTNPIVQYGIASARMSDKIKLMRQHPDMMSYSFAAHDEYFQPNPSKPAKEIYAIHPRSELKEFLQGCLDNNVKPEVECFHMGAFFNANALREEGLFKTGEKLYGTLFFWPGGAQTPPTYKAMMNFVDHLPKDFTFNVSTMAYDPNIDWQLLTMAMMLGGHVRVGWEDNPFVRSGVYAKTNAELVDKIVRIAKELGRDVASPEEAREIIFGKR